MKTLTTSFTTPKKLNFSYLITFIGVIFAIIGSESVQNYVSTIGILSFGILHGANDLKILSKKKHQKRSFSIIPMWIIYLIVVFFGVLIFYFIPGIALFSFVGVSCYHFGEQHWEGRLNQIKEKVIFYIAYGSLIFLMLFCLKYNEVNNIIFQISTVNLPFKIFLIPMIFISFFVLTIMIKYSKNVNALFIEFMLLGLLALLFLKGSLLFGFGFYFVLWHSFPSLKSQVKYLYNQQEKEPYKKYFKSGFLYWMLALIGLSAFYFFSTLPKDQYLSVFFSFLAAITFPHVVVMGIMFNSNKNKF